MPAETATKLIYLLVVVCSGFSGVPDYDLLVEIHITYVRCALGLPHGAAILQQPVASCVNWWTIQSHFSFCFICSSWLSCVGGNVANLRRL